MESLQGLIREQFGFDIIAITPAKRGYWGETWKLETSGDTYFVKLDYFARHQILFRNSLAVVEYLCNNGADFVGRVVKTRAGKLYAAFNSAILAVFEWIDGENIETDETKPFEYQMLCEVYRLSKPGFNIPRVEFSDDQAHRFYSIWENHRNFPSIIEQHKEKLAHYSARLSHFSAICKADEQEIYITHGDAGGNFLAAKDRHYIVDWDEARYATLERDAWVMACRDWALKLFNDTLERNKIPYKLRPERLAFYCYHMFLLYLSELLTDFISHGDEKEIMSYFSKDNFIWERIRFADSVF
jgi:hypothetical protein